jgi:carboxyl-terminal processing protease
MPIINKQGRSGAWIPLVMTLMLAIGFLTGLKTAKESDAALVSISNNKSNATHKVDEVLGFISQRYVDSIDVDNLAEAAIRLIVDSLDPHSYYMDAETVRSYQSKMEGHYDGIGIEFRILRDTIVVTDVLDKSPAEQAGLNRGDQILVVNQDTVSGKQIHSRTIYDTLKGKKGSKVEILIKRCKDDSQIMMVERGTVRTKSVPVAIALDDQTVFVVIEQFNANTSREFLDILEPFHEAGKLKNLVIDLRGNPGGYLQEAVKILNQFFDKKGKLLVYTQGINSDKTEYKTAGRPYLNVEQLYILVDEESASASEIVAGAIQDLDRGVIVGRRSFGKGLVQEQYELSHGGSLKLTVAKYYTPSGRLIQKQLGNHTDYEDEFIKRAETGEWLAEKDIPKPDSIKYYTPAGREFYGSRGIVPDIFVSMDSFLLNKDAYQWYVLKEELAFDLYQYSKCDEMPLEEIEESLGAPYWKEFIKNHSSLDNYGRLLSLNADHEACFKHDLISLLHRYDGGKIELYNQDLEYDPYIKAVMSDLQTKAASSQLTKK